VAEEDEPPAQDANDTDDVAPEPREQYTQIPFELPPSAAAEEDRPAALLPPRGRAVFTRSEEPVPCPDSDAQMLFQGTRSSKEEQVRQQLLSRAQQVSSLAERVEHVNEQATGQLALPTSLHLSTASAESSSENGVELSIITSSPRMHAAVSPSSLSAAPIPPPTPSSTVVSGPNAMDLLFLRFVSRKLLGVAYLALSALVFSFMALCVSLVSKELPSFEIVWARSIMQFTLGASSCYFVARTNPIGPPAKRKWLFIRGLVGFLSFSCYYYSMSRLSLADATTLKNCAPFYTGILGYLFLRERVSRFDLALTLVSIGGVILIVRSGADTSHPSGSDAGSYTLGLVVGIVGSVVSACVFVAIRKVGPGVNPLVLVSYMGLVGTVLAPFGATVQTFRVPSTTGNWWLLFGVGIFSYIGQIFFNAGVQLEKAGPASMIRNLDVAFSFIWQATILHDKPSVGSILGALVIWACVATMGARKWMQESSKARESTAVMQPNGPVVTAQQPENGNASAPTAGGFEMKTPSTPVRSLPAPSSLLSGVEDWRAPGTQLHTHLLSEAGADWRAQSGSAPSSNSPSPSALEVLSVTPPDDPTYDGAAPLFRRKYSLELEATDMSLHEDRGLDTPDSPRAHGEWH